MNTKPITHKKERALRLVVSAVIAALILTIPGLIPERNAGSTYEVYAAIEKGWEKQADGAWKYYAGGTAQTGWKEIGGKWYCFTSAGIMRSGWLDSGAKRYYLGGAADGAMKTGWQKVDERWYYFGSAADGAMKTGWQKYGGNWYFLGGSSDGVMKTGWQLYGGSWYYLGSAADGKMKTAWQSINGAWYFFGISADDGKMKSGWQLYGGNWYYLGGAGDGKMKTGWLTYGGNKYYLGGASDGKMKTGWQTISGTRYYFNENGVLTDMIEVSQTSASVREGLALTLFTNKDADKVTWSSSDESIATVDAAGKITGKKTGAVIITAKSTANGTTAQCSLTVYPYVKATAVSITVPGGTVYPGYPKDLDYSLTTPSGAPRAANDTITWSSSDTSVATVDSSGLVTGKKYGTVTITVKTEGGVSASAKVPVRTIWASQSSAQLTPGTSFVTPIKAYGTTITKYSSSNSSVASVSSSGMITANLRNTSTGKAVAGTVTITATTADGDSTSVSIKVVDVPTIVDLSHHQGTIDWSKASKSIDLAILRISDSDYLDTKYFEYSTACKDYGVPFGVYSYSRYRTKAQAEAEATLVYNRAISGGRKPAFFVIDAEVDYINRANTEAYIAKLRSLAGKRIKVGVYAANHLYTKMNLNLTTDVTNPKTPDFVWIPRYSTANNGSITGATAPTYRCDIWQYSSGGRIPGINGSVDMDTLYKADGTKLVNNANVTLAWLSKPA